MKTGFPFILIMVLMISCVTRDICDQSNQSELIARFKKGTLNNPEDTLVPGVSVYGLRQGMSDSLLYDSVTASRLILPLDPRHGESRFVMNIGEQQDTLEIVHDNDAYLISYDCGFGMLFNLRNIQHTGHVIRDVELINAQVDAEFLQDEEHIWIFY
ncbi:MAG: DUF6452 family protein [Bacteroidales bacterium]